MIIISDQNDNRGGWRHSFFGMVGGGPRELMLAALGINAAWPDGGGHNIR